MSPTVLLDLPASAITTLWPALVLGAELDPIPQFEATAKLGEFLEARFSEPF